MRVSTDLARNYLRRRCFLSFHPVPRMLPPCFWSGSPSARTCYGIRWAQDSEKVTKRAPGIRFSPTSWRYTRSPNSRPQNWRWAQEGEKVAAGDTRARRRRRRRCRRRRRRRRRRRSVVVVVVVIVFVVDVVFAVLTRRGEMTFMVGWFAGGIDRHRRWARSQEGIIICYRGQSLLNPKSLIL